MSEEFKYTTSFSSELKSLISEEKDKYLAMATLMNLADFVPDVDTEKNMDLLPVAFNAFVANRVNKNGDVIDTETAVAIHKNFINKPINIEHNRERVVGVILTAGFSAFGTDRILTEDQAKGSREPFNVTLGGVIWKVTNSALTDLIEEAADPTSENYSKVSASWELGFSEYSLIVLPEGEKNIEDGQFITDVAEIEAMESHLRAFGGSGKLDNGNYVYRQVVADVVPLGIGLTESPAADVKGILASENEEKTPEDTEQSKQNNSSQTNKNNVKIIKVMKKIESIKDINDESLQELSASSISDFIQSELEKASEQYQKDVTEAEEALKAANEKSEGLEKEQAEMSNELAEVKSSLEELEKAKAEKEAEERFNNRMSLMDEKYELNDEDRKFISSDIKDLDEEAFSSYQEKMAVLLRGKDKELLAQEKAEAEAEAKTEETKESVAEKVEEKVEEEIVASSTTEEAKEIVDEVVDNAEETSDEVPVSSEAEQTLYDKYAAAFSLEGFDININRK
tara:strand:+ start:6278 stop:7813 length:1536 start_codon:yes stop_codon:yes gene_type:complete